MSKLTKILTVFQQWQQPSLNSGPALFKIRLMFFLLCLYIMGLKSKEWKKMRWHMTQFLIRLWTHSLAWCLSYRDTRMQCMNPSLHKTIFLQMRCCRVSRQWPSKQWKKSYESLCFQQEEEYVTDTCQNLQAWFLVFQKQEGANSFWLDLDPLSPLRCKVNVIKYKATTWLWLSSGQTFLFWREMTVPGHQSWCQWRRGFVKQALSETITTIWKHKVYIN